MRIQILLAAFVLSGLVGCATTVPTSAPKQPSVPIPRHPPKQPERPAGPLPESARPAYNLSGFPPATREGYIDGCETAKKTKWGYKDMKRYETDAQYQMGWQDGFSICSVKK